MSYDPRQHGALCDACPLRDRQPVPPTTAANPSLVIVGEGSRKADVVGGRPFCGTSGYRLDKTLKGVGFERSQCHVTNAVLCSIPKGLRPNELNRIIHCCRPRLVNELLAQPQRAIFAAGVLAMKALGDKAKLTPWMGAPLACSSPLTEYTFVGAPHPNFILAKPAYEPLFRTFMRRALATTCGRDTMWVWPTIVLDEGPEMLVALERLLDAPVIGVDVETAGIDPMQSTLLCVGLAAEDSIVSVPWPMSSSALQLVRTILSGGRGACGNTLVMHNGQHDVLTLKANNLAVTNGFDTLLAHAVVAPRLPHDLGFVATCEFPAPRWKTEFRVEGDYKGAEVFTRKDPHALRLYNAKDAYMTYRLHAALARRLQETHEGQALFADFMRLALVGQGMRERGVLVDLAALEQHRGGLTAKLSEAEAEFKRLCPAGEYKLGANGAHKSLKDLFFKHYKLQPRKYSEITHEPSLDEDTLTQVVATKHNGMEVAKAILNFRKHAKLLSTYVDGIPLSKDNRLHPVWKVHGARTGRWSSAEPNMQNIPAKMRNMLVPTPGCVLTAGDFSQLELRIVALLANDQPLLEAYKAGLDVHTLTARALFGVEQPNKRQRNLAKTIEYGVNYNASDDVRQILSTIATEYPDITEFDLKKLRLRWFKEHPAIVQWQQETMMKARLNCYVEELLSGRRQYYNDGVIDANEVLNFPIQGMAGTLTNRAVNRLVAALPPHVHLLLQVHDELVVEGPDAEENAALLQQAMVQSVTYRDNTMLFSIDVHSGDNWQKTKG